MDELTIKGAMIYWAEGNKKRKDGRHPNTINYQVRVTNTDPDIIRIYVKFLREKIGIDETRLRVRLVIHSDLDLNEQKEFWSNLTKIPLSQFTKPGFRKVNKKGKIKHGICAVTYSSKEVYLKIESLIEKCRKEN